MTRWIFAAVASLALVGAGIVHGFWTDRWRPSSEVEEAADRLSAVPTSCGDWGPPPEGQDVKVKPDQVGAGVAGCLQRKFVNRVTGQTVVIALVNGRPGPVATHTPEVCYVASGYTVDDKRAVRLGRSDRGGQFWTSVAARTRGVDQTKLRLYWAWNGGDGWTASADPRGQFSRFRYPVLHKLYVLRDLSNVPPPTAAPNTSVVTDHGYPLRDEVCESFLEAFLPELDRALFGRTDG
jgi:hypothetical protein